MRTLVVACLLATLSQSALAAQDADYLRLIESYRRGNLLDAATAMAAWTDDAIRRAARRDDVATSQVMVKAAAMLHTEVAFALWPSRQSLRHFDAARHWIDRLRPNTSGGFTARWRVLAAAYQLRSGLTGARIDLNRALGRGQDSRHADLMLAALRELAIRGTRESNLRDSWASSIVEKEMRELVAAYRRVLDAYPDFLEARLRLGWALHLNHSDAGREHLEQVAARADRPELRYLANLFLGAVAEREQRLDEALRSYEAANRAVSHQSALLGIVAVAGALGDQARAQRAARDLEALTPGDGEDPWTYYNAGLTGDAVLESLRAEVRAP